jgi:hypothetical protein
MGINNDSDSEDDRFFCDLLASSGYLTIWKTDNERYPWRYNLELMSASPEAMPALEEYCWTVLSGEEDGPNRFIVNHGGYVRLSTHYGVRFFRMMADLYSLLASRHATRIEVATKWLECQNLLKVTETPPLRPHTPEWFEALEVWNPVQAELTRKYIQDAGNPDICSVCGDDPASDYRLEEAYRPPSGVDTLRLCAD